MSLNINKRFNPKLRASKKRIAKPEKSQKRAKHKKDDIALSEESYRRLFETAQDGILLLDADTGEISDVNPFLINMLGYSKKEFLNKHLWEIGPFVDVAASKDNFRELQAKKYVRYENLPLETKNGKKIDVEFVSNVYLVGKKKVIQCNVRNITERAMAARELKEATDFYESLIKHSPYAIVLHRGGMLKFINPKGLALLGATPNDQIIDQPISRFIHPSVIPMVVERLKSLKGPGSFAKPAEEVFLRLDGSPIDVEVVTAMVTYHGENAFMSIVIDITDRKRMEKELLDAKEDKFRKIFDCAKDGILLVDINTEARNLYMANEAFCNMLGYDACEIANLSVPDIHPAKDLQYVINKFESQVRRETSIAEDIPVKRKDGTVFYADINSAPVTIEKKKYLLGFFRDLSERKKVESLLRANEKKYRELVETIQEGIWEIDKDSNTIYANPRMASMLGRTPEELLGKPWYTYADEHWIEIAKHHMELRKQGIAEQYDFEFIRKDGSRVYAVLDAQPLFDEKGNYTGSLAGVLDITERKKSEYAIQALNRQIELILGATKTGLDIIDSDLNVVYIDPEWKKIYGDNKGKKCYEYFMGRDSVCPDCGAQKALDTKKPFVSEELLSKEGGRPVQVTTIPFQDNDGRWMVAEVNVDISERKKWEEEKRYASELKASTEIRSRFTSMVSHELRSPLSAIKEGVSIVLEGLVGSLSDQQKSLLTMSKRNIDRLARLINNVLDFQKIEAGKMEYNIRVNNIKDVIQEVSNTMGILAKERNLVFTTDVGCDIPDIEFDRDKIIQVLINLVGNAIKSTEKGKIAINAKRDNDEIHITVEDTGMGISKEDLEKLFRPFEQLTFSARRQKGGTGLGLAISKEMVLAHDGKIWAESEEGKGSIFHFTLPILKIGGAHG